jgi:predicted enzyme related to lactoylglutathione lyase
VIIAVHALLYSRAAEAARRFFRETLKLSFVDAGGGWPIFALPPTELAVHPTEDAHAPELYLVCDDVEKTVDEFRAQGVEIMRPITDQGWGRVTSIRIPGEIELGLYEPRHKLAVSLARPRGKRSTGATRKPARKATRKTVRKGAKKRRR